MDWVVHLPVILVWGFACVAAIMLGFALWSLSWPSVKGLIEVSFLDMEPGQASSSDDSPINLSEGDTESHCLAYSYEVAGVKYLGANVKPWGVPDWVVRSTGVDGPGSGEILWSGSRDAARWYRPGVVVDVYYCPRRPQWACLEPGGFIAPFFLGGIAVFTYFVLVR